MSNGGPHEKQRLSADDVIAILGLAPHPEGGHFRETFRDAAEPGRRAASTAIYFLLKAGEQSHWHKVDAAEAWHFYAGDALLLEVSPPDGPLSTVRLGTHIDGRRTTAERRTEKPLATSPKPWRMDARRLHRRARLHVRRLHARCARTSLQVRLRGWIERRGSNSATSFERYPPLVPRRKFFGRGAMAFNPRDNCRFGS